MTFKRAVPRFTADYGKNNAALKYQRNASFLLKRLHISSAMFLAQMRISFVLFCFPCSFRCMIIFV